MGLMDFINEDTIYMNINYSTKEEFFKNIHDSLYKLGYVTEEFNTRILEREEKFPTGINICDYGVAIPHTDAKYIRKEFISINTFKRPLVLKSMNDKTQDVYVGIAFILGFNQAHNGLNVLAELMNLIRDKELIKTIINSKNSKEILNIIKNSIKEE